MKQVRRSDADGWPLQVRATDVFEVRYDSQRRIFRRGSGIDRSFEMIDDFTRGYRHTQKGHWSVLLFAIGIMMLVLGWLPPIDSLAPVVVSIAGALMFIFGASFHHLTVADEGDHLLICFGPLPLFRKKIFYKDIRTAEVGRTSVFDGWGIHLSLRGGWVWNIRGRDCVVIQHKGKTWVGTDDSENLAQFLNAKIAGHGE